MRFVPRTLALMVVLVLPCGAQPALPPASGAIFPLSDLKPGQHGIVWTVFRGTQPEPFEVEVTGIVKNTLGPGKSLILCQMTDPRVQNMGAVAGMSGSPLYIDGRLAGCLSYQVQSFETVHYAGFTPAADLDEVGSRVSAAEANTGSGPLALAEIPGAKGYSLSPMRPVFTLSGLSPRVAELMQPYFTALGVATTALGGSSNSGSVNPDKATDSALEPGDAVSVALSTGDITLAGTGTVSRVDGKRVIAFGHPMMSLGTTELPMCQAEIVTIIPSSLESIKVANTGPIIGTITEDRLSAVSGTLGQKPDLISIDVAVNSAHAPQRKLHFNVARQQQLSPLIIASGVTQAIVGSNDAGFSNGFSLNSDVTFSASQKLASKSVYAGPQAFALGLNDFVKGLAQDLQNPYAKTFPEKVSFTVEPLDENPAVTLEQFTVSRSVARGGETIEAQVAWRDYQGADHVEKIPIPIDPSWTGKKLEVLLAPGPKIDELTGKPRLIAPAELRSFDAYLAAVREDRPNDGFCLVVVEKSDLFTDQAQATPELPGSLARIAAAADEARFQQRGALLSLWEKHLLPGKISNSVVRRPLRVVD